MDCVPLQSWGSVTTKWLTVHAAGPSFETPPCPRLLVSTGPFPPEEEGRAGRPSLGWPPVRSTSGQGLAMDRQRYSWTAAPGEHSGPCGWVYLLVSVIRGNRAVARSDSFGVHLNSKLLVQSVVLRSKDFRVF